MASKSSIEAGRGHVTLSVDDSLLDKGLKAASEKLKSWGKGLMAAGAGIAATAGLITAPFLYGLNVFSEWGREVITASRLTGIGFEAIQGIAVGLRSEVDELVRSVGHMNQILGQAAHGSAEASRTIQELGLDVGELLGPMSQEDRVRRFSEAIAGIGDAAQRGAAARAIFGRGAVTMDFSGGVEGLRQREARAREIGGVMSAADANQVQEYNKSLKEMQLAMRGLWASIGAAAAPAIKELFDLLVRIFVATRKWIDENRYLLDIVFRVADKVVLLGFIVGGLGTAIYAAGIAVSFLKFTFWGSWAATVAKTIALGVAKIAVIGYSAVVAACSFVVGLFTGETWLLIAALGALAGGAITSVVVALAPLAVGAVLLYRNWDTAMRALDVLITGLRRFAATATTTAIAVGDAIAAGDWELAAEVAWAGVELVWTRGVNFLLNMWDAMIQEFGHQLIDFYEDNEQMVDRWIGVYTGVIDFFKHFGQVVIGIFDNIKNTINGTIDSLLDRVNSVRSALGLDRIEEQTTLQEEGEATTTNGRFDELRDNLDEMRQRNFVRRHMEEVGLENALDNQAIWAQFRRMEAEVAREMAGAPPDPTGFSGQVARGMVLGGFSAQQAFGFLGAHAVSENPMLQQARQAAQQRQQEIDLLARVVDELRNIANRVAPRFA